MLRLVHPAPSGQGIDPPKRRPGSRSAALILTPEEVQHVRTAIRNLARAYGTWGCLALVMGIPEHSLQQAVNRRNGRPSAAMVLLAARAGGTTVEQILSGKIAPAGRCPTCGRAQEAGGAR